MLEELIDKLTQAILGQLKHLELTEESYYAIRNTLLSIGE